MVEDLKASDEISSSDDMGGFTLPPEGNILKGTGVKMQFTGEIKDSKPDGKGLTFKLVYCDDPTARANIYCNNQQTGLAKIVGIGKHSGLFDKIDKIRIARGKTPIQSANGNVTVKILMDSKFRQQMRKEIEGLAILCTINHTEAKPYKDEDTGEEKEGFPQANISKIASVNKKLPTAAASNEKGSEPVSEEDEFE